MTAAEFREFVAGVEEFTSVRITQDGIKGIIGNMSVYIDRHGGDEYLCRIHGSGFSAQRRVSRANLLETLRDGYGLWSL